MRNSDNFSESVDNTPLIMPEENTNVKWGPLLVEETLLNPQEAPVKQPTGLIEICGGVLAILSVIVICVLFTSTAIRSIEQIYFLQLK